MIVPRWRATFFVPVGLAKPKTSAATAASISSGRDVALPTRTPRRDRGEQVDAREAQRVLAARPLRDQVRDEQRDRRDQDGQTPWFFEAH